MKKLFKKSIACLIAVLMVIASLPFTAITAQAGITEDRLFIQGKYQGGAPKFTETTTTQGNTLSNQDEFMKGIVVAGNYGERSKDVIKDYLHLALAGTNSFSFKAHGMDNLVAVYDGTETSAIRIPVVVETNDATNQTSRETYIGIDHVSLRNGGNFALGNGTWTHCSSWTNFDNSTNNAYDFSSNESVNITTRPNNSGAQRYVADNRMTWKNYISYNTENDTFKSSYVDTLTNIGYHFQADLTNRRTWLGDDWRTISDYKRETNATVTYKVLNYAPLKAIMDSQELKTTFETVSANESHYDADEVAAYYSALAALYRFNLTDNLTTDTADTKAAEMKTLVDNYNKVKGITELPQYSFKRGNDVIKTVYAKDAAAALQQAPALTPTTAKTHKDGTEQHAWTEYSWVQNGNTFTETGSENTEDCAFGEVKSNVKQDSTCTVKGITTYSQECSKCGYTKSWDETDIDLKAHDYKYEAVNVSKHTITCKNCDLEATEARHNFDENNTCTDCGMTVDFSTFDAAVATLEAELEKGIYTEESVAQVQEILNNALDSKDNCANQDALDALAATLTESLELLQRAAYNIIFSSDVDGLTSVDESEHEYGEVVTFTAPAGKVLKWTVEAQNGTTNLGTTAQSIEYVVTRDAVITVYVTQEAESETEKYSKVTFEGHNGAVVAVMYVKAGETFDTSEVDVPAISFYEPKGWNKATVTGTGSDITVRAIYKAVGTEKCTVTFGDFQKDYDYDAFVYLKDADENTRYAMYDSNDNLLTYFVGKEFYAPHTDAIVIKEATEDTATSAITGYYKDGTKLVYNSKFYLPENTTLVKAGVEVTVDGKTVNFYADKVSARNEFSYAIDFGSLTGVEVKARSFVEYKDADGNTQFAYSEYVTETL